MAKKRGVNPGGPMKPAVHHAARKSPGKMMPAAQYAAYIRWLDAHHFTKKQRAEFDKKKRERQKKKRAEERKRREVQLAGPGGGALMSKRRGIGPAVTGPPAPPPSMSPSQYAAYLRHLNSVQYTRAQRLAYNRGRSAGQRPQPTRRTVALAGPELAGAWILGGNDRYADCAAAAVANSLLACTGVITAGRDVLRLHLAAAGDPGEGASIEDILRAAAVTGLAGAGPASWDLLDEDEPAAGDGLILDLDLGEAQMSQDAWDCDPDPGWGTHAAVLAGDSVVTWGGLIPVTAEFLEYQVAAAWRVNWEAPGAPSRQHEG